MVSGRTGKLNIRINRVCVVVFGVIFTNKLSFGSNRKIFESTGKKHALVCVVVFGVIFANKLSHGYNPVDPKYKKSMLLTV